MPYIEFECRECGEPKRTHYCQKRIDRGEYPTFCSHACRQKDGCGYFRWNRASEDEIKVHLETQFNEKVMILDSCWGWRGNTDKDGYATLGVRNLKYKRAHRVSWFLKYGSLPDGFICHTCDNPVCTNPMHLFVGDAKQNARDLVQKNRQRKGEQMHATHLKDADVIEIRRLRSSGLAFSSIGPLFRIHANTARSICKRKTWSHL